MNLDEVGVKSEEILKINELVNKSLLVNGSNTEMASAFMMQFTQAMGSGVLQGDEFRSMMENNGYFAAKLAKALDTDITGLRKMSKAGELTSDVLRAAFPKMADEINAAFQKIPPTTDRALTVLRNAFYKIIDDSNSAGKGTTTIAEAIIELANTVEQNREEIVSLFVGVIQAIPSVVSGIKTVSGAISSLVSTSSQLGGPGALELGIIGALLFNGRTGAAGILTMLSLLNNNLRSYGLNIGNLKTSWDEYGKSVQNINDVLSGKRDWNTGELKIDVSKMLAASHTAFAEVKKTAEKTFDSVTDAADKSAGKQSNVTGKALDAMKKAYKDYADEVKRLQKDISDREQSLAEELREMGREGMSDHSAWHDREQEAEEYAAAAKKAAEEARMAFAAGDAVGGKSKAEEAVSLYDKAKDAAADLNREIKNGDQVEISQAENRKYALAMMEEYGRGAIAVQEELQKSLTKTAEELDKQSGGQLSKELPEIAKQFGEISGQAKDLTESAAEFNKAWSNAWDRATLGGKEAIAQLEKELKELTKDRHINIYVEEIEKKAIGGVVHRLARGGKLPGYGGGDRVKALLEPGEFVIRKEAVSKYGLAYLQALNAMRLNDPNTVRARIGGLITSATSSSAGYQRFQQGGPVPANAPAETINVNLNFPGQGRPVPFKIEKEHVKEFLRQMGEMHRRSSS